MELSVRLQAVADMVTEGLRVADVGTDHGYIPIYLVEHQKIRLQSQWMSTKDLSRKRKKIFFFTDWKKE